MPSTESPPPTTPSEQPPPSGGPPPRDDTQLREFYVLTVHILIGFLLVLTIAATAIALDLLIWYFHTKGFNGFMMLTLQTIKYSVLLSDVLLFFVFLYRTIRNYLRRDR